MRRLIDKLLKASKAAPTPMGFGAARQTAARPQMVLVAAMDAAVTENPADYLASADAVLLQPGKTRLTARTIQGFVKNMSEIPLGITVDTDDNKKPAAPVENGIDFLVLSPDSPVSSIPTEDKTGRILQVESSMDDGLLRAINSLPVDAILVRDPFENGLVWHQLMIFRHLANIISKPIIVSAPDTITYKELEALWKAGIDGVVVAVEGTAPSTWQELRSSINKLPPREVSKPGKEEARLPRMGGESPAPLPKPEEDDDEDYE